MAAYLKISQFRGVNINDKSPYESLLIEGESIAAETFRAQTIEAEISGQFPTFVRSQPDGFRFVLEVRIHDLTQANVDGIKQIFSPEEPPGYLTAYDNYGEGSPALRKLLCNVEGVVATDEIIFKVAIRASTGLWEADSDATPVVTNITATGQTFAISNPTSARNRPVFTLKPTTLISNADGWTKFRHIVIANKSELPLYDHTGDGYPILIADLSTYSITPSAAVRVVHNGVDLPRYISGNKLWVNLQFRPRKTFTLADNITNSATGVIDVDNVEGLAGWPASGFFIIDNECIQYSERTATTLTIPTGGRGALGTTAASHTATTTAYWVEHSNLYLMWDYSVAQPASEPVDRQPVINLASSTNDSWVFPGPFYNAADRRSGTWRRDYSEDNVASQYISSYEESGRIVFENTPPKAAKLLANNAILEVPCALSMIGASMTLTLSTVSATPIPIEGYSYRRRVVRTDFNWTLEFAGSEIQSVDLGVPFLTFNVPGNIGVTVIDEDVSIGHAVFEVQNFEAVQNSNVETELSNTFPNALGTENESMTTQRVLTGRNIQGYLVQEGDFGMLSILPVYSRVETSRTNTSHNQEKGVISTQAAMNFTVYGVDRDGYEGIYVVGSIAAIPIFRLRLNVEIPIGVDLEGEEFNEVHDDIRDGTNAVTRIDDITVNFDTNRVPKIVIGSQQNLYFLNGRLTNNTTLDYIDIAFLMKLTEELEIDCANHVVTDLLRNVEVPFAILPSNPKDWFYNKPGTNTYKFDMVGVGAGAGLIDITEVHRNRWL